MPLSYFEIQTRISLDWKSSLDIGGSRLSISFIASFHWLSLTLCPTDWATGCYRIPSRNSFAFLSLSAIRFHVVLSNSAVPIFIFLVFIVRPPKVLEFDAFDELRCSKRRARLICNLVNPASLFDGNSGCLGCWESTTNQNGDGNGFQGLMVSKPSAASEGFWSTSSHDLDLSQRSMSFLILPNLNDPSEFVNHGLLLWNQTRLQWVGTKRLENREKNRHPTISWNATYDSLLGSNKRFTKRIPLSEMVEFLEDVWDEEGLYE